MINIISGIKQYPVKRLWQVVKTSIFQLALEQTTTITTAYEQFVIFSEAACHVNNSRKLSSPKTIRTWSLAVLWLIKPDDCWVYFSFTRGKSTGGEQEGSCIDRLSWLAWCKILKLGQVLQNKIMKKRTLISTSLASSAGIADIISSPDFLLILDCRLFIL